MESRSLRLTALLGLVTVGLAGIVGSQTTPSAPDEQVPEFESFSVTPDVVCANLGLPMIRIDWEVEGDGRSCVTVTANGETLISEFQQPWFPDGVTRCGDDAWTGTATINLRDVFGNNIPESIEFAAELGPSTIGGDTEVFDTAGASIKVRVDCEFGVTPGG